jgi:hypothetical protein
MSRSTFKSFAIAVTCDRDADTVSYPVTLAGAYGCKGAVEAETPAEFAAAIGLLLNGQAEADRIRVKRDDAATVFVSGRYDADGAVAWPTVSMAGSFGCTGRVKVGTVKADTAAQAFASLAVKR